MAIPVLLWYRSVRGKEFTVYFENRSRAEETLKILKKNKVVETYNKGRCARALISKADRCPFCHNVMVEKHENDVVPLLHCAPEKGLFMAHRKCCEKAKAPYRFYDSSDKTSPNKVIYPK